MIKLIVVVVLAVLGSITYEVMKVFSEDRWLPMGLQTALVLVGGIALCVFLPRLRYRFWRFDLRPEELYLERGILNRIHTIVPLRRIQHLDVSQDILEREYDLGKLIVQF